MLIFLNFSPWNFMWRGGIEPLAWAFCGFVAWTAASCWALLVDGDVLMFGVGRFGLLGIFHGLMPGFFGRSHDLEIREGGMWIRRRSIHKKHQSASTKLASNCSHKNHFGFEANLGFLASFVSAVLGCPRWHRRCRFAEIRIYIYTILCSKEV